MRIAITKPIIFKGHSDIKVGTIVNIIRVHNDYVNRINQLEQKCEHYKHIQDRTNFYLTQIELNKIQKEHSQFLDFYI